MSIYDYNLTQATNDLTPPNKRNPNWLAFFSVFDTVLQVYCHDMVFNEYADGSPEIDYNNGTTYTAGQRVRWIDNTIYERLIYDSVTGLLIGSTTGDNPTTTKWIKILNNFIGARERAKYNSQRVVLEYALNKWFKTVFRQFTSWDGAGNPTPLSDIYITNNQVDSQSFIIGVNEQESSAIWSSDNEQLINQVINLDFVFNIYMFSINVPLATWLSLANTPGDRDNVVKSFADNYVMGGVNYNIITY